MNIRSRIESAHKHMLFWGENYILFPLVLALLVGATWFVGILTGRSPLEDVSAIVGTLIDAARLCVAVTMTGLVQRYIYGFRALSTDPKAKLSLIIHDTCVSSFLLLLFVVVLFGLIR